MELNEIKEYDHYEIVKNDEDDGIYDSEGVLIGFKSEDNKQ